MRTGNTDREVPVTLVEIREHLEGIRERWRSGTTVERQSDLVHLDGLLGELDDLRVEPDAVADAEEVDQVRGRIEILMDEIEISVGVEPPPMTGFSDWDRDA